MDDLEKKKLLSEIDERFQSFGERIANFANLSVKVDDLVLPVELLKSSLASVKKEHERIEQDCRKKLSGQDSLIEFFQNRISSFEDQTSQSIKRLERVLDQVKNCDNSAVFETKIAILFKEMEAFLEYKEKNESLHSSSKSEIEELKKYVNLNNHQIYDLKKAIASLKEEVAKKAQEIEILKQSLYSSQEKHEKLSSGIKSDHAELSSFHGKRLKELEEFFQKKFSEIQIPDISGFIQSKDLDELKHKINISSLDAKNSYSKSNALDMQVQILAKKLEGLEIELRAQKLAKS